MALPTCSVAWVLDASNALICNGVITEEPSQLDQLVQVLQELNSFDLEIFGSVMGILVVSFITGHWAGKVVRILSRS